MKYFLTFDGAPHPPYTDRILDVLVRENIKATFFVEGHRIPGNENLLRQIYEAGHALGNHTFSHEIMEPMGMEETRAEIMLCQEKIRRAVGQAPRIIRPPWGKIRQDQARMLISEGFELICWNVSVRDWEVADDPGKLSRRIVNTARPWGVSVMHDSIESVPAALEEAIPRLKQAGFEFEKVSDYIG